MTESVNLVNANVHPTLLVHSVKLKSVQLLAQVRKMEFVKMANVVVYEVIRGYSGSIVEHDKCNFDGILIDQKCHCYSGYTGDFCDDFEPEVNVHSNVKMMDHATRLELKMITTGSVIVREDSLDTLCSVRIES